MALADITKFKLMRVNPFQGMVVDTDIWKDAHEYHRNQQRLHMLAFHGTGILEGLEVTAESPPSLSVTIQPGLAVDPEGNIIIVSKAQRYTIQSREKGTIHIIIQFREVPSEPLQPPDGGQPTRILEAYRIQERDKLPKEPYLELACIDIDPSSDAITNTKSKGQAGKNEINLTCRNLITEVQVTAVSQPAISQPVAEKPVVKSAPEPPVVATAQPAAATITIGHAVLGDGGRELHLDGLQNLVREISRQDSLGIKIDEGIPLDKNLKDYALIYLTGKGRFELTPEQQSALGDYLKSGGVIIGEGCADGEPESAARGAKEFGLAYNQLAGALNCKLEVVQQGHPLLTAYHVFSEVPPGSEPAMLLEGGHMIYSAGDYGCAWKGGHKSQKLSRETIRESFEIGANIIDYARMLYQSTR